MQIFLKFHEKCEESYEEKRIEHLLKFPFLSKTSFVNSEFSLCRIVKYKVSRMKRLELLSLMLLHHQSSAQQCILVSSLNFHANFTTRRRDFLVQQHHHFEGKREGQDQMNPLGILRHAHVAKTIPHCLKTSQKVSVYNIASQRKSEI